MSEHTGQFVESFESHEKIKKAEPYISWRGEVSKEAQDRVDCTAENLAKGAEMLGIPADKLNELAVLFYDTHTQNRQGMDLTRGVSMNDMSFKEGDEILKFKHGVEIYVRDENGKIRSQEDLNEILFHELTHRKQHILGDSAEASYLKPSVQQRIRRAGQLAMAAPVALNVAMGVQAYKVLDATKEAGKNILAAYEVAPHSTVAALALGAAAIGLARGIDTAGKRALHWLHKFDRRENEARRNEALAKEFSIVTVD